MLTVDKLANQVELQSHQFTRKFITELAITNVEQLYSTADKMLLNLEKCNAAAAKEGIIFLQPEFKTEALAESFRKNHYLGVQDRKQAQVHVSNGIFLDAKNKPLWGEYIYGLLPDNRLYVMVADNQVHHSHILAGLPAKAVGHVHFVNGKLITLSNNSGHYKPTTSKMRSGIEWFYKQAQNDFVFEDHEKYSADKVNKGLRYRKASEIVAAGNDEQLTHDMSMEDLADLIETILDINRDPNEGMKYNNAQNQHDPYSTELFFQTENKAQMENDAQKELSAPYFSAPVAKNFSNVDAAGGKPVRSSESIRANLLFTNALEGFSRFPGNKNLERFKAKPETKKSRFQF